MLAWNGRGIGREMLAIGGQGRKWGMSSRGEKGTTRGGGEGGGQDVDNRKVRDEMLAVGRSGKRKEAQSSAAQLLLPLSLTPRSLQLLPSFQMSTANRWLRPEVYPLIAAVGVAVGICGLQLVRNITINPEVRVNKEKRAAGVLENFEEAEKYKEHALRKFVRNKRPEIMASINGFFSDPK
ncbi:hypothetical protein Ancab_024211 [Ancistrocladus abbreviatus]